MASSAMYGRVMQLSFLLAQGFLITPHTAFFECLFKPRIQLFSLKTPGTCQLKGKQQLWDFKDCFIISATTHSHRWRFLYCGFLLRLFLKYLAMEKSSGIKQVLKINSITF